MTDDQFAALLDRLKWLQAAQVNNTVKQVEVTCVNRLGRPLTAREKEVIHRDCLEEVAEIRGLIDENNL